MNLLEGGFGFNATDSLACATKEISRNKWWPKVPLICIHLHQNQGRGAGKKAYLPDKLQLNITGI